MSALQKGLLIKLEMFVTVTQVKTSQKNHWSKHMLGAEATPEEMRSRFENILNAE